MRRRNFLKAGATSLFGTAAFAPRELLGAPATTGELPAPIASLRARTTAAPPPIREEERAERRAKAQRLMRERGIDALFVEPGPSLLYFTGVRWGRSERPFGMLLPREGDAILISPAFEVERAQNASGGRFEIRGWQEDESPYARIADTLREWGTSSGTVAVDGEGRFFIADGLTRAAPALDVVIADPVVHGCRGVKSAHELDLLRFANEVTLEAIQAGFRTLRPGMTQAELARNIREAMGRLGYPGGWVLALFGESSAYPHGAENPEPLREGDVVLVDAGTSVHGYQGDVSRTVPFGAPSAELTEVYGIVREAQSAALAATRPGKTAWEIDTVARSLIADAGYGPDYEYFTHRLGHGIGMEGHEWPYLVRGSEVVLRPGMTFSNEPGIYQYGKFGVRLEDIMVVTENGAELLTPQASPLG
jgi:Xaa-Pro dipeptidase